MTYLTKTRFKEAIECPDRMFYYGKKNEYADVRADDDFLQELAKNGIQVGELAKTYFPGGIEIETLDTAEAIDQTNKLLEKEEVIIYEAALSVENLLVRVDLLIKKGNAIELIEVKSKSFFKESEIFTKAGGVDSKWEEYVYDIAFQFYVCNKIFQSFDLRGGLLLIDKNKMCSVEGLYQKFRLRKIDGRYRVAVDAKIEIGAPLLTKVDLTDSIRKIINGTEEIDGKVMSFSDYIDILAAAVRDNSMLNASTGRQCKSCPYKANQSEKQKGLRSGFEECWSKKRNFTEIDFNTPSVFDLWNLNYRKLEEILSSGRFFLKDLKQDELQPKAKTKTKSNLESKRGLTTTQRQWIQIERVLSPNAIPYVDRDGLRQEFSKLKFPLHFIDFEVAMNGIPYRVGHRPYHRLAFQFSHHMLLEDGTLAHQGQWIETRIGHDPNIDFVRKLRDELSEDDGSILIYSSYENTILLHLYDVIASSAESDRETLMAFVQGITWNKAENNGWVGKRAMVDMYNWIFDNYLSKQMGNSNSIKVVLPAIINDSKFVQQKYGSDCYGTKELVSKNFNKQQWLQIDENGNFINPYSLLPPVFDGLDRESIELLFDDDELANGGAAMCAYNLLQFSEMSDEERKAIISALYKYCELDTLAMVMIYEGLKDLSTVTLN